MKKAIKKITILLGMMLILVPVSTHKAHASLNKTKVVHSTAIDRKWKTIASVPKSEREGINGNITIEVESVTLNTILTTKKANIRMKDKRGKIVWESSNDNNGTKTYWCGPDVYTVELSINGGANVTARGN